MIFYCKIIDRNDIVLRFFYSGCVQQRIVLSKGGKKKKKKKKIESRETRGSAEYVVTDVSAKAT